MQNLRAHHVPQYLVIFTEFVILSLTLPSEFCNCNAVPLPTRPQQGSAPPLGLKAGAFNSLEAGFSREQKLLSCQVEAHPWASVVGRARGPPAAPPLPNTGVRELTAAGPPMSPATILIYSISSGLHSSEALAYQEVAFHRGSRATSSKKWFLVQQPLETWPRKANICLLRKRL